MDFVYTPVSGIGVRHVQVTLIAVMVIIMFLMSLLPSVNIVAITEPGTSPNPDIPSFPNWTDQSLILSSYYIGFTPTQIIGTSLFRKYGGKLCMILSMLASSLISVCIPALIIRFGSSPWIITSVIIGLCQGAVMPMLSEFISKWAPVPERSTIGTIIFGSKMLGCVFATEITGLLASSWWGWPSVFYTSGGIGLIWCVFMFAFGCDRPDEHKDISQSELDYINRGKRPQNKQVPWSKILKSVPVWSLWMTHTTTVWSLRLGSVEFPTYLNKVLGFRVQMAASLISAAYLVSFLNIILLSTSSEYMINRNHLSIGACRKICNSLASWGTSFLLILLASNAMNEHLQSILIFLVVVCTSISYSGYNINYNDISPNYAGYIFGVGGVTATAVSFVPIALLQVMVTNQSDATQWGHAFWLAAIVTSLGNIFFVIKGTGEVQDWDSSAIEEDGESRSLLKKS